jgi:integrase
MFGLSWPGEEDDTMAPRQKRRDQWRQTKKGTWTCSLGHRGLRVRLFQNRKDGPFYREAHLPGKGKDRASLRTCNRDRAEALGRKLYAALLSGETPKPSAPVTLGELAQAFVHDSPMFLDNARRTRDDARTRFAILRASLGENFDVRKLTEYHIRQYEASRRNGGIQYGDGRITAPVRQRSVQADVKLLKQMLFWACSCPMPAGGTWLERNPIAHVRVKGEADVQRPVATMERFEATRTLMQKLQDGFAREARELESAPARAIAESRRLTWIRAELGLVLLEATGRRRGAIVGLRWADFDFDGRRITWRAEHDKMHRTSHVEYPETLFTTIRDFQYRLGAVGGYVFPRRGDSEQHAAPELLSQRISQAEKLAGLPKLAGGLCHPYRRKFCSERQRHSMKAIAVAGGWTDVSTILRCYTHPEDADVLAVTSEPHKRRTAGGSGLVVVRA